MARVDLVDDLEDTRQQAAEHRQRPALERLGQQRVVGVRTGLARDGPGPLPVHGHFVDQQAHELGDRDRRMRVVHLDRELLVEALRRNLLHAADAQHVLQRARHEEVLLLEPQLLAARLLVVRVEDLGEIFAGHLLVDRAVVVAAIEGAEVEGLGRLGLPQPQRVRRVDVIAEDGRVVGNAIDDVARHPARALAAVFVVPDFGVAAELHVAAPLGPRDLPGIAVAQPLVGLFDLPAVDDLLLEDAELVADAVTQRRHLERRQRIDETRREPAETAVAQARLVFVGQQLLEIEPELRHRRARGVVDAEVDEVVAEMRPHEELGRQIRDGARALLGVRSRRADPALQHAIAHRVGQRHVVVGLGGERRKLALDVEEVVEEGVLERLLAHRNAVFVDLRWRIAGGAREAGYWRTHGRFASLISCCREPARFMQGIPSVFAANHIAICTAAKRRAEFPALSAVQAATIRFYWLIS